jgi:glycosyltransferase involved in cell wall biosynthesis
MNGKSTISVALATCNGCPHLGPQLASIANQTRPPDELVIGDDQSSDDTLQVIERFASEHGIPTYWQRNPVRLGSSRNFEQVIARCQGDIVVFADQDDVWMPQKLARIEQVFRADPGATYVFSDGLFIDERGAPLRGTLFGRVPFDAAERRAFRNGGALDVLIKHNVVTGATLAVRREALLRLVPFELGWVHDNYLALGLTVLGRGILLDECLIQYRRHSRQQIGFARAGWKGVVALARLQNAMHSQQGAQSFERLRTRLLALGVEPQLPVLDDLSGKARFLARRAEMCERPSRAPLVMWRAFRDGGYRRYALGWRQAVLDVVALGVGPGPAPE